MGKPVQSRDLQLLERTEDAITGLLQQAESAGEELLQRAEDAIAGEVVLEAPFEVVEVGMPDVSLVPGKPAVVKVGTKLVRQDTLNIGRMEGSRFRNKCLEFSEDDVVKMEVFTPIMNLVIKTTYESDEAFQAALEKRRRGLKLKRNEEKEEEIDFTLHVTQAHINLVSKALGQMGQDEPTKTRSLNIGQGTTRSEVQVGAWEGSKPVSRFPREPVALEVGKPEPPNQPRRVCIEKTNLHSTGEDEYPTNRIEEDMYNLVVTQDQGGERSCITIEGQTMDGAKDWSFEPVKERMSYEPVSERKKIKKQDSSWTEGANLTDTFFLKSRIHVLNRMVNKVCGEIRIVRTKAEREEEVEEVPEVPEMAEEQEEVDMQLNSVRVQQFCQVVLGVLHPDHHKERYVDDSICVREDVRSRAVYVHLEEYDVDAAVQGPDSAELIQATGLVCRALHNTMEMSDRKRPGAEDTPESAKVVKFAEDSNLSSRFRLFDRLVRRSLQTENMARFT